MPLKSVSTGNSSSMFRSFFYCVAVYLLAIVCLDFYSFYYLPRSARFLIRSALPFSITWEALKIEISSTCRSAVLAELEHSAEGGAMKLLVEKMNEKSSQLVGIPRNKEETLALSKELKSVFETHRIPKITMGVGIASENSLVGAYACDAGYARTTPFCPQSDPWMKMYCQFHPDTCRVIAENKTTFINTWNPELYRHPFKEMYELENEELKLVFKSKHVFSVKRIPWQEPSLKPVFSSSQNPQNLERAYWALYEQRDFFSVITILSFTSTDRNGDKIVVFSTTNLNDIPNLKSKLNQTFPECLSLFD